MNVESRLSRDFFGALDDQQLLVIEGWEVPGSLGVPLPGDLAPGSCQIACRREVWTHIAPSSIRVRKSNNNSGTNYSNTSSASSNKTTTTNNQQPTTNNQQPTTGGLTADGGTSWWKCPRSSLILRVPLHGGFVDYTQESSVEQRFSKDFDYDDVTIGKALSDACRR